MPYNQGPWGKWSAYCVFSDDGGNTWTKGEPAPLKPKSKGWANEVQIAELPDGKLIMNARSQIGNHKRKIAFSEDGGQTWSALYDQKDLVDPMCQGSMIALNYADQDLLLYCGPRHRSRRIRGTVLMSTDRGLTWPFRKTIYTAGFAYSCMALLPNGNIGILFEKNGYESISFMEFYIKSMIQSTN
jgi:sialidase-1